VQQVDRVDRLAPHLRVEVHAAAAQAAGLQHVVDRERGLGTLLGNWSVSHATLSGHSFEHRDRDGPRRSASSAAWT